MSTITTIAGTDNVGESRAVINTNFSNLNTDKIESGANVSIFANDSGYITPTQAAAGTDNNQTGTSYTLVLTDEENKTVWMSNASANELTIPPNSSVAFPIGTKINIIMEGAGVTTIKGGTGVTLNGVSTGGGAINNQYQGASISKRGTDTWIVLGDIGTVA